MASAKFDVHFVIEAQVLPALAAGRIPFENPVEYFSIRKWNLLHSNYSFKHY